MRPQIRHFEILLCLGLLCCAKPVLAKSSIEASVLAAQSVASLQQQGMDALKTDQIPAAIAYFSEWVVRQPQDAQAQTLLAVAYHLSSQQRPEALDLAIVGYDLAVRAESGQFLPLALAGYAAQQKGRYRDAMSYLSRAVLLRPNDATILAALASAAYMSGDVSLASVSIEQALRLNPNPSKEWLRLAALSNAANQQPTQATEWLTQLQQVDAAEGQFVQQRLHTLAQTAALDGQVIDLNQPPQANRVVANPDQIALDVAIILSQNTQRDRQGVNLLDGLSLQYGYNRDVSRQLDRPQGAPASENYQRSITESIGIPQLNYSLNLFNRGGQFYSVVARPQLTAYRGEQSEFFVGRSLNVAVRGVNNSSLEKIDVGIEMKVTPLEITATGTKVRIETGRSFLTTDAAGNFSESLNTFRQRVVATAEIRFGETLLLSGLSETVEDSTYSKTPWLGSVPLLKTFFNQRNNVARQDSVLVLVTPANPLAIQGQPWARPEHVRRLTEFWTQVVDPSSHAQATTERLAQMRFFSRMTKRDAELPMTQLAQIKSNVLREFQSHQSF